MRLGLVADQPRQLLNWLVPYVFGKPNQNFQGTGWSGTRNWVGATSVVVVLGALASPQTLRRTGGWFFFALGTAVLAKNYGFPGLRWVGILPIIEQTNIPVFALPVAAFCAAVLVGIGVQALADADIRRRRFLIFGALLLVGVGVLIEANHEQLAGVPRSHLLRQFGLATLGASVASYMFMRRRGQALIALMVFAELVVLTPRGFQSERVDPFVRPAWLAYTARQTSASKERVYATDAKLFPNTAAAYGIQDIRALDALYPERYVTYIRTFIQPRFGNRFVGGPYGQPDEQTPAEIVDNRMFDLTGVRYVITSGRNPGDTVFFNTPFPAELVRPSTFDIGGDQRAILFVHSGARATLFVPRGATKLQFAFAMAPQAFDDLSADGVDAFVAPSGAAPEQALWSGSFVPRQSPPHPVWQEVTVDVPDGVSSVDLIVNPRANSSTDWSGFANLRFTPGPDTTQYRPVTSSDGAHVYENAHRLPPRSSSTTSRPSRTRRPPCSTWKRWAGGARVAHSTSNALIPAPTPWWKMPPQR